MNSSSIYRKLKKYLIEKEEKEVRLCEFCAVAGIKRESLIKLCESDEKLAILFERLCAIEENYIVSGAERGDIPVNFATLRLKQKPFCYKEKSEEKIEKKQEEKNFDITIKVLE